MISGKGGQLKIDIHSFRIEAAEGEAVDSSWWPMDCLRSLGRVASIAAGGPAPHPPQQHAEYRGFRILTTGRDGVYLRTSPITADSRSGQTGRSGSRSTWCDLKAMRKQHSTPDL
jgi:hypothetical protein